MRQTSLSTAPSKLPRRSRRETEPHVEYFDIHQESKIRFLLVYQILMGMMGLLLALGYLTLFVLHDMKMVGAILIAEFCILPLMAVGLYLYQRYLDHESVTQLEVDSKYDLVKYSNARLCQNLLFHSSQVEDCTIFSSLVVPFQLDYLRIRLKNGPVIHISGLVADPRDLARRLSLRCRVIYKWVNPLPDLSAVAPVRL